MRDRIGYLFQETIKKNKSRTIGAARSGILFLTGLETVKMKRRHLIHDTMGVKKGVYLTHSCIVVPLRSEI